MSRRVKTVGGPRGEECCTYVVEFSDGTIKVGQSKKPATRIKQHAKAAACFGLTVVRSWSSGPHREAIANERTALDWCVARASAVRGAEWFAGIAFADVKAVLVKLPATRYAEAEYAAYEARIRSKGDSIFRAMMPMQAGPTAQELSGDLDPNDPEHVTLVAKITELTPSGAYWVLANAEPRAVLRRFLQDYADAYAVKDEPRPDGVISEYEWMTSPHCDARWVQLREPLYDIAEAAGFELTDSCMTEPAG